jgi:polar amino acid transport system substrate-binding protein
MRRLGILPLLLWALHADAADLVLSADEWCPYNCDPRSDHPGFAVEIARAVFAGTGRGVDYRVASWTRSLAEARAGRFDGVISASPAEEPDFIYPMEPVGMSRTGIAVRRDSDFRPGDANPFEGRIIGAIDSYSYFGAAGAYIRAHAADPSRIQFLSGSDALVLNLRKLAAGRVDIVIDDANVLALAIDRQRLGGQLRTVAFTDCKPVYIAFSYAIPDGLALARAFDSGIARLRASGRLAGILARYKIRDCT